MVAREGTTVSSKLSRGLFLSCVTGAIRAYRCPKISNFARRYAFCGDAPNFDRGYHVGGGKHRGERKPLEAGTFLVSPRLASGTLHPIAYLA
jgi:hypothetical protein